MTGILSAPQRQALRDTLDRRAGALRREIGAVFRHHGIAAADPELAIAETDRDARELAAVEQALSRLDDPGFGVCADCGVRIGWDRLLTCPHAVRCVKCEAAHERDQPHPKM